MLYVGDGGGERKMRQCQEVFDMDGKNKWQSQCSGRGVKINKVK